MIYTFKKKIYLYSIDIIIKFITLLNNQIKEIFKLSNDNIKNKIKEINNINNTELNIYKSLVNQQKYKKNVNSNLINF